jgi:hypothetical protein
MMPPIAPPHTPSSTIVENGPSSASSANGV